MKRLLSVVLALMLLVGTLAMAVSAADEGYTAKLFFATSDWSYNEDGTNAQCQVNGAGTYTISFDVPEGTSVLDAGVFVIDIGEETTENSAADAYKDLVLSALSVKLDGVEVPVDASKMPTGNLEEHGRWRIELYNQYGSTKDNPPLDPATITGFKNMTIEFTLAEAQAYDAYLAFSDSGWDSQAWANDALWPSPTTSVKGSGTYTLSWDIPEGQNVTDAFIFCVDVIGGASENFKLTEMHVTADGTEIPVDIEKVATGDLETNGNFRMELRNEWGSTKDAPAVDPAAVVAAKNLTVTFTLAAGEGTDAPIVEPDPVEVPEFDPAGTYHAYLGLQTPNWTYRDAWNSDNGIGSDYWGDFIYGNETNEKYGKVVDAEIAGNGTYTVSLTDFGSIIADDFATASQEWFNLLFISTDIPNCDQVKFTDVQIIMDGKKIQSWSDAVLDGDSADYAKILIQNIWNEDMKELNFYAAPTKSVEMTFTVSGFNYDKAGSEAPDPTAPAPTQPTNPGENESGSNTLPIVLGVVAAVAVIAVIVVVVNKKKKQ